MMSAVRFLMGCGLALLAVGSGFCGESLLLDDAFNPSWSPDGTSLVCNRPTPTYSDEDIQIWQVPASGGNPDTLIVDTNGAFFPMWLPDGRHIVYHRVRAVAEFVVYNLDSGESIIWPVPSLWDDPGFSLSPGGSEILYTKWDASVHETWALNLQDGSVRFVHYGSGATISPDGQWIAFFTSGDTLAVEPLSGGPVRYFELGCRVEWTPDSKYLVFTGLSGSGNFDLILRSRDGSLRYELTDDPAVDWMGGVSPDGKSIAYHKVPRDPFPCSLWVLDLAPSAVNPATWGHIKTRFR